MKTDYLSRFLLPPAAFIALWSSAFAVPVYRESIETLTDRSDVIAVYEVTAFTKGTRGFSDTYNLDLLLVSNIRGSGLQRLTTERVIDSIRGRPTSSIQVGDQFVEFFVTEDPAAQNVHSYYLSGNTIDLNNLERTRIFGLAVTADARILRRKEEIIAFIRHRDEMVVQKKAAARDLTLPFVGGIGDRSGYNLLRISDLPFATEAHKQIMSGFGETFLVVPENLLANKSCLNREYWCTLDDKGKVAFLTGMSVSFHAVEFLSEYNKFGENAKHTFESGTQVNGLGTPPSDCLNVETSEIPRLIQQVDAFYKVDGDPRLSLFYAVRLCLMQANGTPKAQIDSITKAANEETTKAWDDGTY